MSGSYDNTYTLAAGMNRLGPSSGSPKRKRLIITNMSIGKPVNLTQQATPNVNMTANMGIPLLYQGSSYLEEAGDFINDVYQGDWFAFSPGLAEVIAWHEEYV